MDMLRLDYHDDFIVHVPSFCHLPFGKLILNSWGQVSMCCHQLTQLGTLTEDVEIIDIWRNAISEDVRRATARDDLHPACTSWNSCPFIVEAKTKNLVPCYRRCAYPYAIEICLPDKHCNVGGESPTPDNPACIMCRRNWDIPQQADLTEFLCRKTKPLMPFLRQLSVLGIAEPFWKDAVFKIFDQLEFHRYKHRCEFTTNTNVICLDEPTIRRFFEAAEWSSLSFSLDAATPETFRKIRRMNVFESVLRNARNYLKLREQFGGAAHHKVCVWNNINLLNLHEMTQMVELSVDLGVDSMVMLPTYDQAGVVKLGELMLCDKNVKLFKKAAEAAMKRAKELGLNLTYIKRFDVVPPPVSAPTTQPPAVVQLELPKEKFEPPPSEWLEQLPQAALVQLELPKACTAGMSL